VAIFTEKIAKLHHDVLPKVRFTENIEAQLEVDPRLIFEYPTVKVRNRPWCVKAGDAHFE